MGQVEIVVSTSGIWEFQPEYAMVPENVLEALSGNSQGVI